MILDSGRQTNYYLDIYQLIVDLSCTKMCFLSKIWFSVWVILQNSRNESICETKKNVLSAKFHSGPFLQICVDYWDRLDRRAWIYVIYSRRVLFITCCGAAIPAKLTTNQSPLLRLICACNILCLQCSWRKAVPGSTSPWVPTRTHIINIHFHFTKSVSATVNTLMGAGCGEKG